jgi:hypothetical protein
MTPRKVPCPAITDVANGTGITDVVLGEIFGRVAIDPHVEFLGKMWYTGYAGERRDPAPCMSH